MCLIAVPACQQSYAMLVCTIIAVTTTSSVSRGMWLVCSRFSSATFGELRTLKIQKTAASLGHGLWRNLASPLQGLHPSLSPSQASTTDMTRTCLRQDDVGDLAAHRAQHALRARQPPGRRLLRLLGASLRLLRGGPRVEAGACSQGRNTVWKRQSVIIPRQSMSADTADVSRTRSWV